MTNEEAIETLKANYPDACFEELIKAVDAAIEALEKGPMKDRESIHEYVEDFINCTNKETCQECKCQTDGDYFICALLQFYRDNLIDRFCEFS